jgi:hypothetical protein
MDGIGIRWARPGSQRKIVGAVQSCVSAVSVYVSHSCNSRVGSTTRFLKTMILLKQILKNMLKTRERLRRSISSPLSINFSLSVVTWPLFFLLQTLVSFFFYAFLSSTCFFFSFNLFFFFFFFFSIFFFFLSKKFFFFFLKN